MLKAEDVSQFDPIDEFNITSLGRSFRLRSRARPKGGGGSATSGQTTFINEYGNFELQKGLVQPVQPQAPKVNTVKEHFETEVYPSPPQVQPVRPPTNRELHRIAEEFDGDF